MDAADTAGRERPDADSRRERERGGDRGGAVSVLRDRRSEIARGQFLDSVARQKSLELPGFEPERRLAARNGRDRGYRA